MIPADERKFLDAGIFIGAMAWHDFLADGIVIAGPPSTLASHAPTKRSQNI